MEKNKSLKLAIILTDIFLFILVVMVIALPSLVTWYVEIKGKSPSLPTTILVTCYPCAPFTGISLYCLRRILKNTLKSELFSENSDVCFRRISLSCAIIALITLFAGRYYLPFYIVGGTFAFLSLLSYCFRAIVQSQKD